MKRKLHKIIYRAAQADAAVSAFLLIGTVGAIECETVTLTRGSVQAVLCLLSLFGALAGAAGWKE